MKQKNPSGSLRKGFFVYNLEREDARYRIWHNYEKVLYVALWLQYIEEK